MKIKGEGFERIAVGFCFFILFIVYLKTLPPTITPGDAGELAAAGFTMGIGHPPGYALYTILLRIFSFIIPAGDIAFRMNFFASAMGVMAVFFVFRVITLVIRQITRDNMADAGLIKASALTAALCLGFSHTYWFLATGIKGGIYILANSGMLVSFYFTFKYTLKKNAKSLYLSAYFLGFLPVLHHTTMLGMLIMAGVLVYNSRGRATAGQKALAGALFLLSFASPYIYLFVRVKTAGIVWAGMNDYSLIIDHITRMAYIEKDAAPFTLSGALYKTSHYASYLAEKFNILLVFAVFGLWYLFKKSRKTFFGLVLFYLLQYCAIIFVTDNSQGPVVIYVNRVFYMTNNILMVIFAGIGIYFLLRFFFSKTRAAGMIAAAAVFFIPVLFFMLNFDSNNRSGRYTAYDSAINTLKTPDKGDILFIRADTGIFNVHYVQNVMGKYEHVRAYDRNANVLDVSVFRGIKHDGKIKRKDERQIELKMVKNNPDRVFYKSPMAFPEHGYLTRPYGILYKICREGVKIKNAGNLMRVYSMRDYLSEHYDDYFRRELAGLFIAKKAEYAAQRGDMREFEMYRKRAEQAAGGVPTVIRRLAYIYFYDLRDFYKSTEYLERAVKMQPYFFPTINLLINIYSGVGHYEKAEEWLRYIIENDWNKKRRLDAARKFNELRVSRGRI